MPSGIQTNRPGRALPTELAQEIIQTARGNSAIMQLARNVTLHGRGRLRANGQRTRAVRRGWRRAIKTGAGRNLLRYIGHFIRFSKRNISPGPSSS